MFLQLQPTIPLDTEHGKADAHLVLDYGENRSLFYVVFVRDSGECWILDSRRVKLERNVTMGVRVEPKQATKESPVLSGWHDTLKVGDRVKFGADEIMCVIREIEWNDPISTFLLEGLSQYKFGWVAPDEIAPL